jgi:hypothetical protein
MRQGNVCGAKSRPPVHALWPKGMACSLPNGRVRWPDARPPAAMKDGTITGYKYDPQAAALVPINKN